MTEKQNTWGGRRPGSGRKQTKVEMPKPYVLPETEKEIWKQAKKKKLTFGELLDEKFTPSQRKDG